VKTCAEVQKDINELRRKLKQDKREYDTYRHLSEQQRCDSESPLLKCEKCECWKAIKEYYS
jgi:hypothetical protein